MLIVVVVKSEDDVHILWAYLELSEWLKSRWATREGILSLHLGQDLLRDGAIIHWAKILRPSTPVLNALRFDKRTSTPLMMGRLPQSLCISISKDYRSLDRFNEAACMLFTRKPRHKRVWHQKWEAYAVTRTHTHQSSVLLVARSELRPPTRLFQIKSKKHFVPPAINHSNNNQ